MKSGSDDREVIFKKPDFTSNNWVNSKTSEAEEQLQQLKQIIIDSKDPIKLTQLDITI